MLPGLGGGTGGVQLSGTTSLSSPTTTLSPQNAALATSSGSMSTTPTTTMSSAGIAATPGASLPAGTLPTPTPNNNLSPTGHTTALPGQNAPAGTPQPTVTQMLNDPNLITSATTDLAAQYGTMGTNNSSQSTDLANQYNTLHSSLKGSDSPATNPMRSQDMQDKMSESQTQAQTDPQKSFFDQYSAMNPVMKQMYDTIQQTLSSQNTRQSFVDELTKLQGEQGIPGLQTDLMNIKNIMGGTEDDIRNEITKAGGFATESQVAALTATRNKVLLKQATALQDMLTTKEDYVKQIMDLSKADQAEVDKQVDTKLGLVDKLYNLQKDMNTAATANYQKTLTALGNDYTAFASTIPNNLKPTVENLLGLGAGTLSNPKELAYLTDSSLKQQQLAQGAQRLQVSINNAGSLDDYRAALTQLAGARTLSANASAVNATMKALYPLASSNPITQYNNASIYIGNVNTAYAKSIDPTNKNKGASDLELIDAAVKLNNGGQQVTQTQVDALVKSLGLPGKITVEGGKVTGISGIIDNGTRQAIRDLATSNLITKRQSANEAVAAVNARLGTSGAPSNLSLSDIKAQMSSATNYSEPTDHSAGVIWETEDGTVYKSDGTQWVQE